MNQTEKEFMSKVMQRVIELLDSTKTGDYPLALKIGLGRSTIQSWRNNKSNASAYALGQVADYFNVSVDYLLGRVELQQNTVNNAITSPLLARISKLDKSQQDKVMAYIDGLSDTKELFNQGRIEQRERQLLQEENYTMQQKKKI